MDIFLLLYRK